jgi:hypothetical protein
MVVSGTIVGSLACFVVLLARPWSGGLPIALAVLLAGPVFGSLVGLRRRSSWQDAAAMVDDHYQWLDSTSSALEFAAAAQPLPFQALQIRGALERLAGVQPRAVVPIKAPRTWPLAAVSLALALATMIWSIGPHSVKAGVEELKPYAPALEEARELEKDALQIEAMARQEKDPVLDAMLAKIRQTIDELKQPGLDMRQTMAKISALEASIAAQKKELNVPLVDRELKALGSALVEAKPLEPTGRMLQEARFGEAAQELDKVGDEPLNEGEAATVEQLASKSAEEMKAKGLNELGKATQKLADGIKRKGGADVKEGSKDLAKEIRDHERRRRINKLMAQEEKRLQDCKDRCATRNLIARREKEAAEAAKNGGKPSGAPDPGSAGDQGKKSGQEAEKKPSVGEKMELKGQAGEGPSERETVIASDGELKAARRRSQKVHQKYHQLSEEALEQEPIPLGYRRTIRRYFELIRPTSTAEPAATPSPTGDR